MEDNEQNSLKSPVNETIERWRALMDALLAKKGQEVPPELLVSLWDVEQTLRKHCGNTHLLQPLFPTLELEAEPLIEDLRIALNHTCRLKRGARRSSRAGHDVEAGMPIRLVFEIGHVGGNIGERSVTIRLNIRTDCETTVVLGDGIVETALPDRLYVIFCRVSRLDSMSTDHQAAAQQVLVDLVDKCSQDRRFEVLRVYSSVYGRFLCVRNSVPALYVAEHVLEQVAKRGVHLAIGMAVGRLEEVEDIGGMNLIGPAINLAARLAALQEAEDKIFLTKEVFDAARQNGQFPKNSFVGPNDGAVKRATFQYYIRLYSPSTLGPSPRPGKYRTFDSHSVVFDIARFSEKTADEQFAVVSKLHRIVIAVIRAIGAQERAARSELWHAPAGDGAALVFSPDRYGGERAWLFARELAQQCHGEVELRLGIATGSVVLIEGQLPVGTAILRADKLCSYPPNWGFCVNRAFWNSIAESVRKGWHAHQFVDDDDALVIDKDNRELPQTSPAALSG